MSLPPIRNFAGSLFKQVNGTWDMSRMLTALLGLAYIGQSAFAVAHGQHFDWQSFGIGAGSLTAGGGAGVWMHGKSPQ